MTSRSEFDRKAAEAHDAGRGRIDPERLRRRHPDDHEARPEVSGADAAATKAELDELKRRTRRRSA